MKWFLEWLENVKSILEMDSNSFYPIFVFLGAFFVVYFFCEIVMYFLCLKGQLGNEWKVMIVAIVSFVITMALTRMTWMRKRLLGDKVGKRIVVCSNYSFNMFFMFYG